jgi:hypothetical protein
VSIDQHTEIDAGKLMQYLVTMFDCLHDMGDPRLDWIEP